MAVSETSIIEQASAHPKVIKKLAKLDQNKYKIPHNVREELRNMHVAIKMSKKDVADMQEKRPYSLRLPDADDRADLTAMNEHVAWCAAYRERINMLSAELLDTKRYLEFLSEDIEDFVYSKFEEPLTRLRTDKMRSSILSAICRPVEKRLRMVDDLLRMCSDTTWSLKSVHESMQLICDNVHRSLPNLSPR